MAIAQVATGAASGSGTTLALTGVTCAAGNVLAIDVLAVNTGNTPISVTSVTDNAGGSTNAYSIPAPANTGAFFTSQNQFAAVATVWCQVTTALSAATVTITFSTSAGFSEAEFGTYSGVPGNSVTLAAASSTLLTTASSAASPSAGATPGCLAIAVCNVNGAASSVSSSYALRPDNISAWLGTTAAGSTSTTFTLTASSPVWGTTITVIGAPVTPGALVVPQAAVMQAANW